jgi:hypothetical protein
VFYYPDDSRYDGEFRKNKRDGEGTYYYSNGAAMGRNGDGIDGVDGWMSEAQGRQAGGVNVFHSPPPFHRLGPAHHTCLLAPTGNRYEGQWVDNLRSGQGVLYYADGGKYEGYFKVSQSVPPIRPAVRPSVRPSISQFTQFIDQRPPCHTMPCHVPCVSCA